MTNQPNEPFRGFIKDYDIEETWQISYYPIRFDPIELKLILDTHKVNIYFKTIDAALNWAQSLEEGFKFIADTNRIKYGRKGN